MSDQSEMDISQQLDMWNTFTRMTGIGVVFLVVLLALMAFFLV